MWRVKQDTVYSAKTLSKKAKCTNVFTDQIDASSTSAAGVWIAWVVVTRGDNSKQTSQFEPEAPVVIKLRQGEIVTGLYVWVNAILVSIHVTDNKKINRRRQQCVDNMKRERHHRFWKKGSSIMCTYSAQNWSLFLNTASWLKISRRQFDALSMSQPESDHNETDKNLSCVMNTTASLYVIIYIQNDVITCKDVICPN